MTATDPLASDPLAADIEELWTMMRHLVVERVDLLHTALQAGRAGTLDYAGGPDSPLGAAQSAAHKLAGTLGSYRRSTGSAAARDAEEALTGQPVNLDALAAAVTVLDQVLAGDVQ